MEVRLLSRAPLLKMNRKIKYIAKKDTWFDEGTEAELICECGPYQAVFKGFKDGKLDEELCSFEEFDII